jgi:hypothetical protein
VSLLPTSGVTLTLYSSYTANMNCIDLACFELACCIGPNMRGTKDTRVSAPIRWSLVFHLVPLALNRVTRVDRTRSARVRPLGDAMSLRGPASPSATLRSYESGGRRTSRGATLRDLHHVLHVLYCDPDSTISTMPIDSLGAIDSLTRCPRCRHTS